MNYTLALLVGALIVILILQNLQGQQLPTPELLKQVSGEQVSVPQSAGPVSGMEHEATIIPSMPAVQAESAVVEQPMMNGEDELPGGNVVGAYGDFPPTDQKYFKPHGDMGDAASSPAGMITSLQAGCAHPVDNCNRFYCEGCGPTSCQAGGEYHDTDDIRRNYTEVITKIRAKRNNEYPFYIMS